MGVIALAAIPGVEHREHAGQGPEMPFDGTKVLDRRGRNLHQEAIINFWLRKNAARNPGGTVTTA